VISFCRGRFFTFFRPQYHNLYLFEIRSFPVSFLRRAIIYLIKFSLFLFLSFLSSLGLFLNKFCLFLDLCLFFTQITLYSLFLITVNFILFLLLFLFIFNGCGLFFLYLLKLILLLSLFFIFLIRFNDENPLRREKLRLIILFIFYEV
jgi:hypothetical protein